VITAPLATPKQEDRELARRLRLMTWLCSIAFLVLAGRLWQLQVLQGEMYLRKSADNFVKDIEIPALRGQVRDHKGRVLADNRVAYNVYVTPRFLTAEALERLREYLGLTPEQAAALKTRAAETRGS
jgi:penicillin-binding protein 2